MKKDNKNLKICNEKLFHFNCGDCMKWWTIGDADEKRDFWYCPWCGKKQKVFKNTDVFFNTF